MTIGSLAAMLEQLDPNDEIVIEISNSEGEAVSTYDIGFGYTGSGEFTLKIHA